MRNIFFIIFFLFILNGCRMGPDTYEIFEYNMNFNVGRSGIPNANPKLREIYSEDKYIYLKIIQTVVFMDF
ncbi:MAG: hypothetical protein WCR78_06485 [Arcobacteraceae bacterium]